MGRRLLFIQLFLLFSVFSKAADLPINNSSRFCDQNLGIVYDIVSGSGFLAIASDNGLFIQQGEQCYKSEAVSNFTKQPISSLLLDNDRLWVGSFGEGYIVLDVGSDAVLYKSDVTNAYDGYVEKFTKLGERIAVLTDEGIKLVSVERNESYYLTIGHEVHHLAKLNAETIVILSEKHLTLFNINTGEKELLFTFNNSYKYGFLEVITPTLLLVQTQSTSFLFNLTTREVDQASLEYLGKFAKINDAVMLNEDKLLIAHDSLEVVSIANRMPISNLASILSGGYIDVVYKIEVTPNNNILIGGPRFGIAELPITIGSTSYLKHDESLVSGRFSGYANFGGISFVNYNYEIYRLDHISSELTFASFESDWVEMFETQIGIVALSSDGGISLLKWDEGAKNLSTLKRLEVGQTVLDLKPFNDSIYAISEDGSLFKVENDFIAKQIPLDFGPDILFNIADALIAQDYYNGVFYTRDGENWFPINTELVGSSLLIECVHESVGGVLYFCTSGNGLLKLEPEEMKLSHSKLSNHIQASHIRGLTTDRNGRLWIATSNFLYRASSKEDWAQMLGIQYGILDTDFEYESLFMDSELESLVIFGDKLGYLLDIDDFTKLLDKHLIRKSRMIVSKVSAFETGGHKPENQRRLEVTVNDAPILINSDVYQFDVHFAAVDPIDHNYLDFEYRLIGLSENWQLAKRGTSTASYSALPFGDYEFQVRAVDYQSKEQQPITSQKIRVLPPIWLTQAAFLIYFLLAVLLYFLFLILAKKAKKRQLKFAEDYAEERTMALHEKLTNLKEALVKEKTIFSSLSAELRTPLTYLQGWLTKSIQSNKPDVIKDSINSSLNTVQRVNCLIEQFDEIENLVGNERLFEVTVEVRSSINSLAESFEQIAKLRGIRISIKGGKGLYIRTHKSSFERIFSNLIGNAIKYTLPNTEVTLSIKKKVEKVVISIIDQGEGIQESELHQIFERFSKLDNNSQLEGSGLGLAVVKEQLEANNGEIRVESSIGVGTEFHVTFKLTEPPKSANEKADMDPNKIAILDKSSLTLDGSHDELKSGLVTMADKATVLIADSSVHIRNYLADMFEPTYHCIRSVNGKEALDIALTVMPNVIIADIDLPLLNGLKLTTKIRENEQTSTIPIIIISANSDRSTKINALSRKADDFILKPFEAAEIKFKVEQIIKMRPKLDAQLDKIELAKPETVIDLEHIVMPEFDEEKDQRFYMQLVVLLQQNYQDPNFNKDFAATSMNCTERQINRKLNDFLGLSFTSFVKQYRLKKAAKKLLNSSNISEVAFDLGFGSPSYFGMCFRDYYEMTPSQFIACGGNVSLVKNKSKKGTKVAKSN